MARLQFTSDLLPAMSSACRYSIASRSSSSSAPGPVFTRLLLADEINRASPKAQSALLEAMEERQVSVDGVTHRCPSLFRGRTQNRTISWRLPACRCS